MHSYPWYIDNWRASNAVAAMTAEERGIYRELLDQCWRDGSLPNSERALQVFARVSDKEWKRSRAKVLAMFREENGRLFNATVAENRDRVVASKGVSRENGKKGGRPAKPKENPAGFSQVTQSEPDQNHSLFGIRYPSEYTHTAREETRAPMPIRPETPSPAADAVFDGFALEELIAALHAQHAKAGLGDGGGRVRTRHALMDQLPRIMARRPGESQEELAAGLLERHQAWADFWAVERQRDKRAFVPLLGNWLADETYRTMPAMPQGVSA